MSSRRPIEINVDFRFKNAPEMLYALGSCAEKIKSNGHIETMPCVAVIGTRKITPYGKTVTSLVCEDYISKGFAIVSGLAEGVDTEAHRTALELKAPTLAFVAHSLENCYPKQNVDLLRRILDSGAVVSQYPEGTSPMKHRFIERNWLMAAFCKEVVVIEAGAKSGAIITAEAALSMGKAVFAVPNNIFSDSSAGCNALLARGAKPYRYMAWGPLSRKESKSSGRTNSPILDALKRGPKYFEELREELDSRIDGSELLNQLMDFEIMGYVQLKIDGRWHLLKWR